ncbi:MAG: Ig-like domain-containing protein, partial [Lachnospiraceae bacterium]|nr:Ig-like domain-containing protein [Lachnospiraceae bacterium]
LTYVIILGKSAPISIKDHAFSGCISLNCIYVHSGRTLNDISDNDKAKVKYYSTINVDSASNGTISLSDGDVPEHTELYTGDTNVTITVTPDTGFGLYSLSVTDKDGHEIPVSKADNSYIFAMPQKDVTVSAKFYKLLTAPTAVTGLVYNGHVQTGVAVGTGYTLTGNTATDAGTYTATATLQTGYLWSDGTSEPKMISWSIAKTASSATAPTAKTGLVANGQEQELVTGGSATGGTMYYAVTTENTEATASLYTTSIPTASNAGSYKVWYMVAGDKNHNDTEAKSLMVQIAENPVTAIKLDKAQVTVKKGTTLTLTASLLPDNASDKAVLWTAADPTDSTKTPVVTVTSSDAGKTAAVTANDTGKAVVTATSKDGGFSASCEILVVSDELPQDIIDKIKADEVYTEEADKPATPEPVLPAPVKVNDNVTIPISYDSAAVVYNGSKADPEKQLGAKADLTALAAGITIKDTSKTINDLIKVTWVVSGKDKGERYFYPKLSLTSTGKSSAVLSNKDRKTLSSVIKKANKALKKSSARCKFTINKRSLTAGVLSVGVQMKDGAIKLNKKKNIAKVKYVKLKISDKESITLKNGKDCKITLIDAKSGLVKVEAKKNTNFTGAVTLYVDPQ